MDLLLTKNPIINSLHANCINDYTSKYFETATQLNIATGFISNESIAELRKIILHSRTEQFYSPNQQIIVDF